MAKVIFSGLEDSGKSYMLAKTCTKLLVRNASWLKRTGIPRTITSNLEFETSFVDLANSLGIEIRYWRDIEELEHLTNTDLIVDEVGTYFDSRTYKDLPLSTRLWLAQASKLGVDIYGSAQDFAQVDLSFRRLTTDLLHITKLCGSSRPNVTRPSSRYVWGLCTMRGLDPVAYDEKTKKFANSGIPQFFFIERKYCEIFDTTKRIPKSLPVPFKHIERRCQNPDCTLALHRVINGVHYRILHV